MFSVMTTNSTADASSSGSSSNNLQEDAVPGVTMTQQKQKGQRYLEMSSMNELLTETDKDTDILSAWVAIRNNLDEGDDDDDDDASLEYLTDAVSDFFHTVCFCDWNRKGCSQTPFHHLPVFHHPPLASAVPHQQPMFIGKQTADI